MYVFPQKILVKDKPTIKYLLTIAKLPIIGEELWKNSHPTPMFLSHPLEDNKFYKTYSKKFSSVNFSKIYIKKSSKNIFQIF
jgi:hypothetical protein